MATYTIEGQAKVGEAIVWEGLVTVSAANPNDARRQARELIQEIAGEGARALVPALRREKETP